MKACGRGGWALFMFNRIGLATDPRADEIAPAVTRAQTLPSIPYCMGVQQIDYRSLFYDTMIGICMINNSVLRNNTRARTENMFGFFTYTNIRISLSLVILHIYIFEI